MGPHRSLTGKVWGHTLALRNPEGILGFDPMELLVLQETDRFQIGPLMAHHQAFTVKVCAYTVHKAAWQGPPEVCRGAGFLPGRNPETLDSAISCGL